MWHNPILIYSLWSSHKSRSLSVSAPDFLFPLWKWWRNGNYYPAINSCNAKIIFNWEEILVAVSVAIKIRGNNFKSGTLFHLARCRLKSILNQWDIERIRQRLGHVVTSFASHFVRTQWRSSCMLPTFLAGIKMLLPCFVSRFLCTSSYNRILNRK